MCYDPQVMLRERCSCAISERPTSFSVSPLPLCPLCSCLCDLCVTVPFSSSVDCRLSAVDCFSPLTPLFPLDTSHSPVTPLFPLDTQNRGTPPSNMTNRSISVSSPWTPSAASNGIVDPPMFLITSRPLFSANLCALCASALSSSFSLGRAASAPPAGSLFRNSKLTTDNLQLPKSNHSRTSKTFARKSNHYRTYAKRGGWGVLFELSTFNFQLLTLNCSSPLTLLFSLAVLPMWLTI